MKKRDERKTQMVNRLFLKNAVSQAKFHERLTIYVYEGEGVEKMYASK